MLYKHKNSLNMSTKASELLLSPNKLYYKRLGLDINKELYYKLTKP